MKVRKVRRAGGSSARVCDCCVDHGYVKVARGSLPDVDLDFAADRRQEVKQHLEERYNKGGAQRVFAAGTFTTIKLRTAITDIGRIHRLPIATVKYITKIIDPEMSWTDVMKLAVKDKRIREFIEKNPEVFEEMIPILKQPRAAGIHPSAFIIIPERVKGEKVDCFDLLPIRKMGDQLVSEISGYDIDEIGILKNDVLGIQELTRLSSMLDMIESVYGVRYTILQIASQYLNDPKVFEVLRGGNTQGVFQMSSKGMTKLLKRVKPTDIEDLIAVEALFRPATLSVGAADAYADYKNGVREPEYLWGTQEILRHEYGLFVYQESVALVARKVGGLSLGDGVNLVKAISKKKAEKVHKFKSKFLEGAEKNGCPKEAAQKIWDTIEASSSYLFNRSHATAYGLTAYVGAWLKTHYPTPFYTVVLRDQEKEKIPDLIQEMRSIGDTEVVQPDVNVSGADFVPDYKENKIYWSLGRIKNLGVKAVDYIVKEREFMGEFVSLEDFISRVFRARLKKGRKVADTEGGSNEERCPVNTQHVRHLILAGAFDKVENIGSVTERWGLLQKASDILGFPISEKSFPLDLVDKHYFWSRMQIEISSFGSVDYRRICDNEEKPEAVKRVRYTGLDELSDMFISIEKGLFCCTITGVTERSYTDSKTGEDKMYGKIDLQQNIDTNNMVIWDDVWSEHRREFLKAVGRMVVCVARIRWSDYDEKNTLQLGKSSYYKII